MADIAGFAERLACEIKTYEKLILENNPAQDRTLIQLSSSLSRLLELGETCPNAWSENEAEPLDYDREKIQRLIAKRFPDFGYYNTAYIIDENVGIDKISVGDAINDLEEIYHDLKDAEWFLDQGDAENFLWHAKNSFSHWGAHALEVKRYIHKKIYGF